MRVFDCQTPQAAKRVDRVAARYLARSRVAAVPLLSHTLAASDFPRRDEVFLCTHLIQVLELEA